MTGTYSFRITNVPRPQTFAYTVGSTVVNGTPAAGAGNIELPGSVDVYTFTGAAGQKVFVDQLAAASCSLTWSLTGPGGATVFASRGICADPGTFTLPTAGPYTLAGRGDGQRDRHLQLPHHERRRRRRRSPTPWAPPSATGCRARGRATSSCRARSTSTRSPARPARRCSSISSARRAVR